MSDYGAVRSGWDAPARIAGTTAIAIGTDDTLPAEPTYQQMVPFPGSSVSGGSNTGTATTADGHKLWQQTPSRCDLVFYQGDDVIIPLFFNDPDISGDDLSTHTWVSQLRVLHSYRSILVNEFVTAASYHAGTSEDDEYTMVELYLPRTLNVYLGVYRWDLYSIGAADLSRFQGAGDDMLRTWLYGVATIVPRVTSTDVLPPPVDTPPGVPVLTDGGWFAGPNGRVP